MKNISSQTKDGWHVGIDRDKLIVALENLIADARRGDVIVKKVSTRLDQGDQDFDITHLTLSYHQREVDQ